MNLKQVKKYSVELALFLIGVYVFIWIAVGAFHSYPNVEDLSEAAQSRDLGVLTRLLQAQQIMDGRYTTNLLHGINPLAFDWYYGYQVVPIITFLLLFIGVFKLIKLLSKESKYSNFIYAFTFVSLFMAAIDISRALYFMICSFVYLYPIIFSLFFFVNIFKFFKTTNPIYLLFTHLFLFLMIGNVEFYIVVSGSYILGLLIYFWEDKEKRKTILWLFPTQILSSILFVTSPGVLMRFSHYETHREFMSFLSTIGVAFKYSFETFLNFQFIPLIVFIALFTSKYLPKPKATNRKTILLILLTAVTIFAVWFILIFSQGDQGFSPRIIGVPISIGIILFVFIFSNFNGRFNTFFKVLSIICIYFFTIKTSSISKIQSDYFSGKLTLFKHEMDKQYVDLTSSSCSENKLSRVKIIDVTTILPESITYSPIKYLEPNRKEPSSNRAYEQYFRIDEVAIDTDGKFVLTELTKFNEN